MAVRVSKGRILVDIDDTLINLCEVWVNELNRKYHLNVTTDDIKCWDMSVPFSSLTQKQIYKPLIEAKVWKKVKPISDSQYYLKKLVDDGYDVILVTSTDYRNIHYKYKYVINKFYSFINPKNIVICHRKNILNADILVDDYIMNLLGGTYKGILFNSYHNKNIHEDKYGVTRSFGWEDTYNKINAFFNIKG